MAAKKTGPKAAKNGRGKAPEESARKAPEGVDPAKLSKEELERYPVLQLKVYEVEPLLLDPRNARTHGEGNLDSIAKSLKQFGQRKNVVIDREGVVKAGNGTLLAARTLGWKYIIGGPAPVDLVKARAYALADNRTAELAGWNPEVLRSEFTELGGLSVDLSLLGWNQGEIQGLLQGPTDPSKEWRGMPEFAQGDKTSFKHVVVHFADQAAVDQFAALIGRKITNRYIWFPEIVIDHVADKRYASSRRS